MAKRRLTRRLRLAILDRDGWRCVWCGRAGMLEVDHIEQQRHGGTDDPDNLRTLCRGCHIGRHSRTRTAGELAWRRLVKDMQ